MALSENKMSHSLTVRLMLEAFYIFVTIYVIFWILGTVTRSRKATISSVLSVCLSVRMEKLGFLLDRFS